MRQCIQEGVHIDFARPVMPPMGYLHQFQSQEYYYNFRPAGASVPQMPPQMGRGRGMAGRCLFKYQIVSNVLKGCSRNGTTNVHLYQPVGFPIYQWKFHHNRKKQMRKQPKTDLLFLCFSLSCWMATFLKFDIYNLFSLR